MGNPDSPISISTISFDGNVQDEIRSVLSVILEHNDCPQLLMPVFTCINELLINAVKANYKNIYFENFAAVVKEKISYEKALSLFRLEMQHDGAENLSRIAREKDVRAYLNVWLEGTDLRITVTNPVLMSEIEQKNVIRKLDMVGKLHEMSEYFAANDADPFNEGAGLGLVFVGMLLKNLGLPDNSLQIHSDESRTTASLTIPLTSSTLKTYLEIARNGSHGV